MERYKVLPSLSSRLAEVETQYEEMREKNRQLEQKIASIQVRMFTKLSMTNNIFNIPIYEINQYEQKSKEMICDCSSSIVDMVSFS